MAGAARVLIQPFGFKKMIQMGNSNQFKMNPSGRDGSITYLNGKNKIEIYWEMSGSAEYEILVAPIDLKEWKEPKGVEIPFKDQIQILHELRAWLQKQNIKSDIDLPINISYEENVCLWAGCNEKRIKDSAYCIIHYDYNLLRR